MSKITLKSPTLQRLEEVLVELKIKYEISENFYQNWLKNNKLRKDCFPEVLSDEIKDKVLLYSNGDPRSINDAFTKLFVETMRIDDETGKKIALFSKSELCGGWEHFRGKSDYYQKKWELPEEFKNENDPTVLLKKLEKEECNLF